MKTHRESQLEAYYEKVKQLELIVKELNKEAMHLGIETRYTDLRLYKEQNDQLDEIKNYFSKVKMAPEHNTTEAILTISLKEFYKFVHSLET